MGTKLPKLYSELAEWWQVFSPTEDYADEGAFFKDIFLRSGAKTILELGAGGGNVAYYLKKQFKMTLTDLSQAMLVMSQQQNPECEHIVGDMRNLSLGKTYDGVLIHDAIMYMISLEELKAVFAVAYTHCKPGGTVVIAPDCTLETLRETTDFEGHDVGNRSVRYLQWISDPDPNDTIFNYDFIIALKENGELRSIIDRQVCGVFPRQIWLDLLTEAGFKTQVLVDTSTNGETNERLEVFAAQKL